MWCHQIRLKPQHQPKTAFSTPKGHFEYKRMPMGLKGPPATFQRLVNQVMSGMQGVRVLTYLHDIIVYGRDLQEHNERLVEIFDKLREHTTKLHLDKCEFLRDQVDYLGHVITKDGVKPDEAKVSAVKNFPFYKHTNKLRSCWIDRVL
jgi:hypothetical protein